MIQQETSRDGLHHDESDSLPTQLDMPRALRLEPREKARPSTSWFKTANVLQAFSHGLYADCYQVIGILGTG